MAPSAPIGALARLARNPTGGSENPANATAGYGILLAGAQPTDGVPHVVIFGEYQCPACAAVDSKFGPIVRALVADGRMTAEVRTAHFMDGRAPDDPSKTAGTMTDEFLAAVIPLG